MQIDPLKNILLFGLLFIFPSNCFAQNSTSFFTGNQQDIQSQPQGGICLMGGASENDNAMRWFLERADGGDVLVIRTSGSDGYNDYFYSDLGVTINSVETIVFNNPNAAFDPEIHNSINQAEAIWIAGGDQSEYIDFWRSGPIDSLINQKINNDNLVIGGTSAGMAILGDYYYTAENGSLTSEEALMNPYHPENTVSNQSFINLNSLDGIITDTHFDNPDRKGRLTTFLARAYNDQNTRLKAIACDEYTALCIDENGIAKAFGSYPDYDDFVYFVELYCRIDDPSPESCEANTPLHWQYEQNVLSIIRLNAFENGKNSFDLNNWEALQSSDPFHWWVENGNFFEEATSFKDCTLTSILQQDEVLHRPIYFDLSTSRLYIHPELQTDGIKLVNLTGQIMLSKDIHPNKSLHSLPFQDLSQGVYVLQLYHNGEMIHSDKVLKY